MEIAQLKEPDLYQLKSETEATQEEGRDLLAEIASRVDGDIALSRKRLAEIDRRRTAL